MSTRPAGSFCLCFFWQAVRHLWSLQLSGIPHHRDLQPGRNVYLTSWFIVSVLIFDRWWDLCGPYTCPRSPVTGSSTLVGMSTWPAVSFYLDYFWQAVRHLWFLHVSWIPHQRDFHLGTNIFLTSWFTLSVLILTGSDMSVVPTCGQNPHHTDLHPRIDVYLTSWFILSVWYLTGGDTSVVPTCVWEPPTQGPPSWYQCLPDQLVHSICVAFDRHWDVCDPYTCPGSAVTWTFTLVGMSTWPAALFCLCCFWQAVRHLWSLHVSWIPHQRDFHLGTNIYLTSWFTLSVLCLTGGEMSVVPTCGWDPLSHRSLPW